MPATFLDAAPSPAPAAAGGAQPGDEGLWSLPCAGASEVDQGLTQLLQTLLALTQARHVRCTLLDTDRHGASRPLATASAGLCAVDEPAPPTCSIAHCDYAISPGRRLAFQFHVPRSSPGFHPEGVTVLLCALHRWLIWLDLSHGPVGTGPMPPPHRRVLLLMLKGLSEKQIAADLGLSINTAHRYVTLLYRRYGVRNRASLMALWLKPPA